MSIFGETLKKIEERRKFVIAQSRADLLKLHGLKESDIDGLRWRVEEELAHTQGQGARETIKVRIYKMEGSITTHIESMVRSEQEKE